MRFVTTMSIFKSIDVSYGLAKPERIVLDIWALVLLLLLLTILNRLLQTETPENLALLSRGFKVKVRRRNGDNFFSVFISFYLLNNYATRELCDK